MTTLSRTTAILILAAASLAAVPGHAAQSNSEPTVSEVCFIAYDFCNAACAINSPDSGLNFNEYISNQACLRQCVDQLNECTSSGGGGSPARKLSLKKLVGPIFGMDRGSSGGQDDDQPSNDSKPPADTGGSRNDGGFNVNLNFGGKSDAPADPTGDNGNSSTGFQTNLNFGGTAPIFSPQ